MLTGLVRLFSKKWKGNYISPQRFERELTKIASKNLKDPTPEMIKKKKDGLRGPVALSFLQNGLDGEWAEPYREIQERILNR